MAATTKRRLISGESARLRRRIVLAAGVAISITLILLVLHRVGIQTDPGYSSDDVAQQTILSQWQHHLRGGAIVGDDNWVIKFPFYVVMNNLPLSPESRIFITAWLLTLVATLGSLAVLWLMSDLEPVARSAEARLVRLLMPTAVVVGFAPMTLYIISRVNTRNLEIPIFLALLYGLMRFDRGLFKRPWLVGGAVIVAVGLLLTNDPMLRYMGVFLVVVVYAGRSMLGAIRARQGLIVIGVLAGGWVLASVFKKLLVKLLPVQFIIHPQSFTTIDGLINHAKAFASIDLQLLGADFWGLPLRLPTAVKVLSASLLVVSLYAAARLVRQALDNDRIGPSQLVIGLLPFWIITIVLMSGFNADMRYLILLPFSLAVCLVVAASRQAISPRLSLLIMAGFLAVAAFNFGNAVSALVHNHRDMSNLDEKKIVKVLADHHLTKGFATYWHANIIDYYSGYRTAVANINCNNDNHTMMFNPLLSERGILQLTSTNSYVIYYPTSVGGYQECSDQTLVERFGQPAATYVISGSNAHIAVYNRDISPGVIQ